MLFQALYVNGKGDRIAQRDIDAPDIDDAATDAINSIGQHFGAQASWFVVAVIDPRYDWMVQAHLNETES